MWHGAQMESDFCEKIGRLKVELDELKVELDELKDGALA